MILILSALSPEHLSSGNRWDRLRCTGLSLLLTVVVVGGCATAPKPSPNAQPSATASASTTTSGAPVPQAVSLSGSDWFFYGGTAYSGCPATIQSLGGQAGIQQPSVFDTTTGQFITPAVPAPAPDETVTGEACAVTGTAPGFKVIYLLNTTKPASGLNPRVDKKTAYLFDLHSPTPLATTDVSNLRSDYTVNPTSTGAVIANAFAGGIGTEVLSNTDLSVLWTDPKSPAAISDSVLAFPRYPPGTDNNITGYELRAPNGDSIYRGPDGNGAWALSQGPNHLVQLRIWESRSPPTYATSFFDVNSRALLTINGTQQIPGGGVDATLSDGRLFLNEVNSLGDETGMLLWNLQSQQVEFQLSPEQAKGLQLSAVRYFQGHLYVATSGESKTYSVYKLPDTTTAIATNWTSRPSGRLTGWTIVCKDEIQYDLHKCGDTVLVRDQNGSFPGPWS